MSGSHWSRRIELYLLVICLLTGLSAAGAAAPLPVLQLTDNASSESQTDAAMDAAGNTHVVYQRDGTLYYRGKTTEGWGDEEEIAVGTNPAIGAGASGVPQVVFLASSAAWYTARIDGTWQTPVSLGAATVVDVAVDDADVAHVVYLGNIDGDSYAEINYTNNAAGFPASPIRSWDAWYDGSYGQYYYSPVIAAYGTGQFAIGYRLYQIYKGMGWTDWYSTIHVYRSATDDDLSSPSKYKSHYPDPRKNAFLAADTGAAYISYGTTLAAADTGVWTETTLPEGSSHALAFSETALLTAFVDATGGIEYAENAGAGFAPPDVLDATTTGRNPIVIFGAKAFVAYEAIDSVDHEVWLAKTSNDAPVLGAVGDQSVDEGAILSFTLSATDGDGDELTFGGSSLPSGLTVDPDTGAVFWIPGWGDSGTYSGVSFSVSDGADSDSEAVTITVSDANAPPALEPIGDRSVAENETLSFTVVGSDYDDNGLTYSATGLPTGATLHPTTGAFSWTPTYDQAGTHPVTFTVTDDGTPNLDDSETVTITVSDVNRPPTLGAVGDQSVDEGATLQLTLGAIDPDSDGLTYSATGLPTGATLHPTTGAFSWTPTYDQAGDHSVTFTVTDDGTPNLGDSESVTISVSDVNQAPVLAAVGNQSVDEGATLQLTLEATDGDGHNLTYTATGLPTGATLHSTTGAFSWTPTYDQSGNHSVTFTVTDDGTPNLGDSETITISVGDVNRPPALDAIGDQSVDEGSTLSFTLNAVDPDLDSLTFGASNLPTGSAFDTDTRTFSWTPGYDKAGTYADVVFSVSDGVASDSETITITVGDVTPNVLSVADAEPVEGDTGVSTVSLTVTLSPAAGETVTVDWATADGTAVSGGDLEAAGGGHFSAIGGMDFEAHSGQVVFLAGETTATIEVNILGDTEIEGDEVFTVTLSSPTGAHTLLGDDEALVTILNDDSANQDPPFGVVDTPADSATVEGAVAVTGWALDDTGVQRVVIWRDPVDGEPAGSLVYIGDAVFVEGARPDVAAAFPTLPRATRAGWGYMLLTNMLPNAGNGTFQLSMVAVDREGQETLLGTRTITGNNSAATRPFGTLDTPGQGATASGSAYAVFGWALTPNPGAIPTDGSTIWVFVDGAPVGHPVYDLYRADIATLFPGYANTDGAVGYYVLDTTTLANGTHSIAWSVTDDMGRTEGIGSRYFQVSN